MPCFATRPRTNRHHKDWLKASAYHHLTTVRHSLANTAYFRTAKMKDMARKPTNSLRWRKSPAHRARTIEGHPTTYPARPYPGLFCCTPDKTASPPGSCQAEPQSV